LQKSDDGQTVVLRLISSLFDDCLVGGANF